MISGAITGRYDKTSVWLTVFFDALNQNAKSSWRQLIILPCVLLEIKPSFFISLALSTALIWSNKINPFLP